jgi:hypothetical protein
MVENISASSRRICSTRPGNTDRAKTVNHHAGLSRAIVHFEMAFDALVIALLHRRADQARGARGPQEKYLGKAHRKSQS